VPAFLADPFAPHALTSAAPRGNVDSCERLGKAGISFEALEPVTYAISDDHVTERLNRARTELFQSIRG
jgi:hypothetical protein